jgi:hypothetical protein
VAAYVVGVDCMVQMSNDSYSKVIKKTLELLCIAVYHLVHIGRGIGPKCLESLDEEVFHHVCLYVNMKLNNILIVIIVGIRLGFVYS